MILYNMRGILILCITLFTVEAASAQRVKNFFWRSVEGAGNAHPRHENAFVEVGGKYVLLGGRGIKAIDIFDPATQSWTQGKEPPIELHHFQAVSHEGLIYVMGALTGPYPYEIPIANIYIYDLLEDLWMVGPEIPQHRRRGAAGCVVENGKFYLVGGIINGHTSHWVPWLDEYDPQTQTWKELPDAPRSRDHFQAAVYEGKLYAAGGRNSGYGETPFQATIPEVDLFDMASNTWSTLEADGHIPTLRAGCTSAIWDGKLLVIGGESPTQKIAHNEVEALDLSSLTWETLPALERGRHGTQVVVADETLVIVGGCGNRGGNPELTHMEVLGKSERVGVTEYVVKKGELTLETMDIMKEGKADVVIANRSGNQALVLATIASDMPITLTLPVELPYILSPGAKLTFSLQMETPELPHSLLIKAYGRSAPLLVEIPAIE